MVRSTLKILAPHGLITAVQECRDILAVFSQRHNRIMSIDRDTGATRLYLFVLAQRPFDAAKGEG